MKTPSKPKKSSHAKPPTRAASSKATPPGAKPGKGAQRAGSKRDVAKPATARASKPSAPTTKPAAAKPAPEPPPAAPEPAPPPAAPRAPRVEEIPGEAINGVHLARCIRYAAKVTPKEDGEIYFTHDDAGRALISGHNLKCSHTGFLVEKAALHCDIAVPRDEAMAFALLLEGLSNPAVRIDEFGDAVVRHGSGQPAVPFALGCRPITQHWQPPSQAGRKPAAGPLRISASAQAAAVRWPEAIVHTFQSSDGIEWNEITDAATGTLLARAVLAEDGRDLYAEDERQTEFPGTKKVHGPAAQGPIDASAASFANPPGIIPTDPPCAHCGAKDHDTESHPAAREAARDDGAVTIEAGGKTETIAADAKPEEGRPPTLAEATAFPAPGERPVVVEVPEAIWDDLSPDTLDALHIPTDARVAWFTNPTHTASASLRAVDAKAVAALLVGLGYRCAQAEAGRRYGLEVDVWTVGRAEAAAAG